MTDIPKLAQRGIKILRGDSARLEKIYRYKHGQHDLPYIPDNADDEFKALAHKAITNWFPLLVEASGQSLYVDDVRRPTREDADDEDVLNEDDDASPEWECWQYSSMDAAQHHVYDAALTFGHAFVLAEQVGPRKVRLRGLPTRRTICLYGDPATDFEPEAAVYIKKYPTEEDPGEVWVWDKVNKYVLAWHKGREHEFEQIGAIAHKAKEVPVERFCAFRDLEGKTWGVIEPLLPVQDRINQTIFDLLIAQTYTAFEVRTVTGMAPPPKRRLNDDGEWEIVRDADGNPVPDKVLLNANRFMFAESDKVKFDHLPGGDLDGFLNSIEQAIRHLSATSQTPPHFLLGQIANISADALKAAETALARKVEKFKVSFGESWERILRIAMQMTGETSGEGENGEVVWRDMSASSLAQSADALGKFSQQLGVPAEGLWGRVPNVTRRERRLWKALAKQQRDLAPTGAATLSQAISPITNRFGQVRQGSASTTGASSGTAPAA